ncbi:hypothetical protein C1T17_20615 (plasmid) [Sphingobium sp. SCG-1]|nr:hypothetical protein C1T17_20615 [Sphingobium sp. SCG-1]
MAAMPGMGNMSDPGHDMSSMDDAKPVASTDTPPLKIVGPIDGATIGQRVAVVFEGPAQLSKYTMDNPEAAAHLHIALDDTELMPMGEQLISLGAKQYVFIFDLPTKPGRHTISLYWADRLHKKIENGVQTISVEVTGSK